MPAHPSFDVEAERGDFPRPDPDAGEAGDPLRLDPKGQKGFYQNLLQFPHVKMEVAAVEAEIQDRIPHELTWTMIGDTPAPFHLEESDPFALQADIVHQEVPTIPASAKGNRWGMLQEEQEVSHFPFDSRPSQSPLKLKGLAILHHSQSKDEAASHGPLR